MKKLMMLGALLGFLIGTAFGLLQECSWPSVLWRSSVAAAVAGLLLRWWGRLWMAGLREVYERKQNETAGVTPPAAATSQARKK
jgi:hypothetical protein